MPTRVRKLTPKAAAAAAAKSAKPAGGPPPQDLAPPAVADVSFFANDEDVASLLSNLRSAPAAPPLKTGEVNRDEDTNAVAAEKTRKKPGPKKKDPNAPKGPRSSFKFYQMKMRPNFDASHPGTKFIELSIMGESWKKLSDEEKQPYIDLAVEDIARHRREVAAYEASKPATDDAGEQEGKKRGRGRPRGPNYKPRNTAAAKNKAKKETASKRKSSAKPSAPSKKGRKLSAEDEARVDTAIAAVQSAYGTGAEGNKKLAKLALKGVTMRPSGKWQAQLYYAGKSRYLGVFESKEKAAMGYEVARELLSEGKERNGKRIVGKETLSTEQMNVLLGLARYAAYKAVSIADAGGAASVPSALSQKVTDI
ncbi:hypothetical protein ACHAXT_003619 [Thalassiosira profunda]